MAVRRLAFLCVLLLPALAWANALTLLQAEATPEGAPRSEMRIVALPHGWEDDFPGFSGVLEYRMRFASPSPGPLLGVYVQRACSNLEVFVNGELIGSGGRMQDPIARNCYFPQLFPLPRSLLHPAGNELRIRVAGYALGEVAARQRAGGLSVVQVGDLHELTAAYEAQRFWNITAAQIIAVSIGGLGVAMLCLWALRRRDAYLLYFGLFTAGWALISVRLFVREVPLSNHAAEILICSAFPPVLGCAYLFLLRLVERGHRWVDGLLAAQALAVPLLLLLPPAGQLLPYATAVYNLLALEFLLCAGYFFAVAWRTHRQDFWLLGSVVLVALLLAAAEIALQNDLLPLPKVHLIHFAMPLIFVVIGLRLIQLFVRALQQAESANELLELRVAEKSSEIERNWEQIASLRTAQAAQDERRRIASDLHDDLGAQLLSIAQASQRGSEPERIAGMARAAMEEMRLSVRGLTGGAVETRDVLADWRAETVTRLGEAGFASSWEAGELPAGLILPARTQVQLTRVLREAVTNAIRHSGGRRCRVRVEFPPGAVELEVEDDGRGLPGPGAHKARGHGLLNMERRVRNLGGEHGFEAAPGGGTRVWVRVPLRPSPSNWGSL